MSDPPASLPAQTRRPRDRPVSSGKRITLKESDLRWFRALARHGPLPSSYLLAFTKDDRRSVKRSLERLTDLFNEGRTPHEGPYLRRPAQQFRTLDSRYNQLVYDLAPAAVAALESVGEADIGAPPSGPWLHRCMIACTTASIELACLANPQVSYIPGMEILARAEAALRFPVTIHPPEGGAAVTATLIPDALFGLQYETSEGPRYRFFLVECDRATEPATTTNFNRKSWLRSLLQYRAYIGGGLYREHLGLRSPLLVLNVTTDDTRLAKMLAVTKKVAGVAGNAYHLFQTFDAFGAVFKPPKPCPDFLDTAWERAGQPPLRIDQL